MADGRVEYEIRADDSKLDEDLKKSEEKMQKSAEKTAEKQKAVEEKSVENTEKNNDKKVESTEEANQKIVESTEKAQDKIVNEAEAAAEKVHNSVKNASKNVQKSTDDVKNKAVSVAAAVGKAFAAMVTAATAAGTAAVMSGASAESSFAKVKTMLSGNDLDRYYDDLMSLSNETGVSFENLSEAMYQALSAGVSQDKAVEFVKSSVSLSKGGFTEVATAIDVVTTAINAYGLSMEDATHIQDVLIMTQNKGKTTVDELASNMGKIIPTANSLNVSLDQLGAMYATITANGVATAESTTYMNSMLNELASSSSTASKALEEAAGRTFKQLTDEGKTVAEILQIIDANAKQSGKSMTDMFGSAEAAKAAQIIVDKTESFNNNLNAMADSAGAAKTAAATMMDTLGEKINVLVANGKNLLTELGNELAPIVEKAIETIESNLPAVEELLQDFAPVIGSLLMQLVELATGVLPELLDTIKPIMEFVVGTVLPSLIDLIKFVIQFKDVILTAVAALAAYKAAMAISSVISTLKNVLNGATVAQYALNTAMSLNPAGAVAAAVSALIVILGSFISTVGKVSSGVQNVIDNAENLSKTVDEACASNEMEIEQLKKKVSRYDELRTAMKLTSAEQAELKDLSTDLQDIFGSNVEVVNSLTGEYNDLTDALQKYIEKSTASVRLSAYENSAKEAYQVLEDVKKQRIEVYDKIADDTNNYRMMLLPYDTASWIANNKHSGELTALDKAENEAKTAIAQYEAELKSYYENIGDYAEEAASNIIESGNNASTATDSFATSAKSAAQTVSDLTAEMNELSAAFAEQNESGQLSIDTTLKLIDKGYDACLIIDRETGAVRLNAEAYRDLASAKIEAEEAAVKEAKASLDSMYNKKIESAYMTGDVVNGQKLQAEYNAKIKEYDTKLALYDKIRSGIGNVVSGTYSSSTPGGVKKDTASSSSSSKSSSSTSSSSSSFGSSGSGGNLISITSYIPTVWDSETETNKKLLKSSGLTNISKSGQLVSINGGAESSVSTKSSKAVGGSASAYETTLADVVKAVNGLKKSQDEMKITVTSILQCDKRTLAKVTAEGINEITKATGKSPLQ